VGHVVGPAGAPGVVVAEAALELVTGAG